MNKVKIAGAIASKTGITIYLADGREMNLPKENWRTKAILDEALPLLARKKSVEIDLDSYSVTGKIEKKSGGLIRFLRNTVSAIGSVLTGKNAEKHDVEGTFGAIPSIPVELEKGGSVTAVVNGKHIPGVEALERHMERAIADDNIKGLHRFMERIAAVIDERGHSVDELLKFMKRADLPIADDGSIIAYKVLTKRYDEQSGLNFVDPHTKRVTQRVGSFVTMDANLIDPSRRTECSTGLHVARRDYLRHFTATDAFLIKINPEDVIAVPKGEPSKMRVAGYHILFHLPSEAYDLLKANQPMTKNHQAAQMLADAISGNHIGVTELVRISGPMGTEISVTPVGKLVVPKPSGETVKALDDDVGARSNETPIVIADIKKAISEAAVEKKAVKAEKKAKAVKPTPAPASKTKAKAPEKLHFVKADKIEKPDGSVIKSRNGPVYDLSKVPEKWRKAFKDVADGKMSQREAEKAYKISAKKLRALLRDQNII